MKIIGNVFHLTDGQIGRQDAVQSPIQAPEIELRFFNIDVTNLPDGMHTAVGAPTQMNSGWASQDLRESLFEFALNGSNANLQLRAAEICAQILYEKG
jgi:hypothetical protein